MKRLVTATLAALWTLGASATGAIAQPASGEAPELKPEGECDRITTPLYRKITLGMTLEDVEQTLGCYGSEKSLTRNRQQGTIGFYMFNSGSSPGMGLYVTNGKVTSKVNMGL